MKYLAMPLRSQSLSALPLLLAIACGSDDSKPSGATGEDGGSSGAAAVAGEGGSSTDGGAGGTSTDGGSRSQCKRGVAYGYHSEADMAALSQGVSWWYNWAFVPDTDMGDGLYRSYDVAYVPMIWGAGTNRDDARASIPADATVLLGFNEPNFGSQANLSAVDAAALWPELEAIADARGMRLVSPAVNFCGGNCQDTDPFNYLREFFEACQGCRVDAIAIHIYVGCNADGDNKAQWLINHVETYKQTFDLPLWLTEFACDDAASDAEQAAFVKDAVAYLEGERRIEKYAWFSGRADNMVHVDLLGADGELTEIGRAYVDAPEDEACVR